MKYDIPYIQLDAEISFLAGSISWTCPGLRLCDRPPEGRYLIILPVRDYGRMHAPPEQSLLNALSSDQKEDIRRGKALLILDHSNEGPQFNKIIYDIFHAELSTHGVDRGRVVYVGQNRFMGVDYNECYGPGIGFWNYDYFPKAMALWFDVKSGPTVFGPNDNVLSNYTPLQSEEAPKFLSFNAAARWHRLLLFRWLQLRGLYESGIISFHGVNALNPKSHEIIVSEPPGGVKEVFPDLIADIDAWMPEKPIHVGPGQSTGNDLIMTVDRTAYDQSVLSILTESDFFEPSIQRITEKSIKAAAMGVPFIVLGPPNSVAALRELGFCSFSGLIDHSYDLIQDPVARLKKAFDVISSTWERIKANPEAWREAARPEGAFNFSHARLNHLRRFDQLNSYPILARMAHFIEDGLG
jgi:hypothetical protein